MMESSQFTNQQLADGGFERLECQGATSETYCVKLYGKLHFVKRRFCKILYTNKMHL